MEGPNGLTDNSQSEVGPRRPRDLCTRRFHSDGVSSRRGVGKRTLTPQRVPYPETYGYGPSGVRLTYSTSAVGSHYRLSDCRVSKCRTTDPGHLHTEVYRGRPH